MELMRKEGVLGTLVEDAPEHKETKTVINRFKKNDEKARAHIVLNLAQQPATFLTSLIMSGDTSRAV